MRSITAQKATPTRPSAGTRSSVIPWATTTLRWVLFAGSSLKGNSDNNIDIGNTGVAFESDAIRVGSEFQTRTFIAAIRGVTTGIADAVMSS